MVYNDLLVIIEYSSCSISSSGCLSYKWLNAGFACRGWIKLLSRSWRFSSEISSKLLFHIRVLRSQNFILELLMGLMYVPFNLAELDWAGWQGFGL